MYMGSAAGRCPCGFTAAGRCPCGSTRARTSWAICPAIAGTPSPISIRARILAESTRHVAGENFSRPLAVECLADYYRASVKKERESEVEGGDPWRLHKIWATKSLWPAWGDGICDVREFRRDGRRSCEGRAMNHS